MSEATQAQDARVLRARAAAARTIRCWPWLAALLVSVALPWLFYDWQHARHAGFIRVGAEPDRHDDHLRAVV
jgi:hypothetical protein